jgi:hypothetical protein
VKTRTIAAFAVVGVAAILSAVLLAKNTDFAVYWYGVHDYLQGTRPPYGPFSGHGHPQEFRYPPVTMLFFLPLTLLPIRVAGAIWIVFAWTACAWAAAVAITRWRLRFNATGLLLGLVVLGQFIVLFVKFGNVQPYLISLVLLSLLCSEDHPGWSGLALAVATCFKVWPLFFVPWFFFRQRRRALYYAVAASVVLWVAPILYFGWTRYAWLMQEFYTHIAALASNPESLWYSSQSLRGVFLRFLTHAAPSRDGYPDASFASLSPVLVGGCCFVLSVAVYCWAVVQTWRARKVSRFLWDANAFVFFSALQPFAMNSGLISLFPAVLAAMHVYSSPPGSYPKAARRAFLITCLLSAIATCTFWRPLQRWALMLGIDFWIMLALGATLAIAALGRAARETTG